MTQPPLLVSVTVPGEPVSKQRPRFTRKGRAITPARTAAAENAIGWELRHAGVRTPDIGNALGVRVLFRCAARHGKDLDNMVKLVLDACNGIVWHDDVQVVEITCGVREVSDEPGIDLDVFVLEPLKRSVAA